MQQIIKGAVIQKPLCLISCYAGDNGKLKLHWTMKIKQWTIKTKNRECNKTITITKGQGIMEN